MDVANISLFALADRRLAWTDRRSETLAQNIANADTSGYRARDLPSFAATLTQSRTALPLDQTNEAHLAGTSALAISARGDGRHERAPDGNNVSLDEQLMRVAETDDAHRLTTDLYRKYLGMFRTAIGH